MKKTVSVNISNVRFVMDEDAYELLGSYLDALTSSFARSNYDSDIVEDIESRIAEILLSEMNDGVTIVSVSLIESIIERLGQPEDFIDETAEEGLKDDINAGLAGDSAETLPPPFAGGETIRHRLFRDPRNKILGGVCSGVASYFGIDVVWVRIIFVICLFLTASTACIVYLILWVIIPEASKPLDFLELEGETPTLSKIGKTVTDTFKNGIDFGTSVQEQSKHSGINRFLSVMGKIAMGAIIVVGAPIVIALAVALIVCVVVLIALGTTGGALWLADVNFPAPFEDPVVAMICSIVAIIICGIPIVLLILAALNTSRGKPILSKGWGIALAILWLAAFATAGIVKHMGLLAID